MRSASSLNLLRIERNHDPQKGDAHDNYRIYSFLLERFQIEGSAVIRSGIYGLTQRLLAYNSNKIEGSTLTEEQTASLFDHRHTSKIR